MIDTSGRGKITYNDFAAKFRPGQLKFGWLEEALKGIGRSFTTKRRGGQVEKDAQRPYDQNGGGIALRSLVFDPIAKETVY